MFIYDVVFVQLFVGRGAALAVLLGITGVVLMLAYFKLFFNRADEEAA